MGKWSLLGNLNCRRTVIIFQASVSDTYGVVVLLNKPFIPWPHYWEITWHSDSNFQICRWNPVSIQMKLLSQTFCKVYFSLELFLKCIFFFRDYFPLVSHSSKRDKPVSLFSCGSFLYYCHLHFVSCLAIISWETTTNFTLPIAIAVFPVPGWPAIKTALPAILPS